MPEVTYVHVLFFELDHGNGQVEILFGGVFKTRALAQSYAWRKFPNAASTVVRKRVRE